jgi:predicted amidophosphoribosyltransferase
VATIVRKNQDYPTTMKTCPNCNAELEDNFELCWNCNFSLAEKRIVEISEITQESKKKNIDCLHLHLS